MLKGIFFTPPPTYYKIKHDKCASNKAYTVYGIYNSQSIDNDKESMRIQERGGEAPLQWVVLKHKRKCMP